MDREDTPITPIITELPTAAPFWRVSAVAAAF
jgi:hypothetical protein